MSAKTAILSKEESLQSMVAKSHKADLEVAEEVAAVETFAVNSEES